MSELLLISSSANNMAARDWYPTLDTRSAHLFSVVSLLWWTGTSPPMITSPDSSKGGPRWRKNDSVYRESRVNHEPVDYNPAQK